jgi:hypothetical protein
VILELPTNQTKEKTEEKGSGPCSIGGCTYSYDATFDATGLPAATAQDPAGAPSNRMYAALASDGS